MKIDIHTHCKWSKQSELSKSYLTDMLDEAAKHLDALALTEHFDTVNFEHIYHCLDELAVYENGHYRYRQLIILPGIEVDVAEGGHIIVIGEREAIRTINEKLRPHRTPGHFIQLEQLLELCDKLACVRIGAHPFRKENSLHKLDARLLRRLDALDLNGRDLYKYGRAMEEAVNELARQLDLPVVAGSDTHHYKQYGCVYNQFAAKVENAASLRQALRSHDYHYCIAGDLPEKVKLAEQEQQAIKAAGSYRAAASELID